MPVHHIFIVTVTVILLHASSCYSVATFNRNRTGIVFSTYRHDLSDGWKRYSLEDMKTMMKVISNGFSKIITFNSAAEFPIHQSHSQHFSQVHPAEAAALVNKEMSEIPEYDPLSMYLGIHVHSQLPQLTTEINFVRKSIDIANKTFPGTVQGIVLTGDGIHSNSLVANLILKKLFELRESTANSGLKLGTLQTCKGLEGPKNDTQLCRLRKEIVNASDFIICKFIFNKTTPQGFADVVDEFTKYENHTRLLNPEIEIMGQTGVSARINNVTELATMRYYWRKGNTLAENFKINIWMTEAFDSPSQVGPDAHFGWWKLKDNSKPSLTDSYIEKVAALKDIEGFIPILTSNYGESHVKNGVRRHCADNIIVGIIIFLMISVGSIYLKL